MPNKDGFDASREIIAIQKESDQQKECKILALTSFTDIQTYQRCLEIGMKEVFNKPANIALLEKLILKYHFNLSDEKQQIYNDYMNILKASMA